MKIIKREVTTATFTLELSARELRVISECVGCVDQGDVAQELGESLDDTCDEIQEVYAQLEEAL